MIIKFYCGSGKRIIHRVKTFPRYKTCPAGSPFFYSVFGKQSISQRAETIIALSCSHLFLGFQNWMFLFQSKRGNKREENMLQRTKVCKYKTELTGQIQTKNIFFCGFCSCRRSHWSLEMELDLRFPPPSWRSLKLQKWVWSLRVSLWVTADFKELFLKSYFSPAGSDQMGGEKRYCD